MPISRLEPPPMLRVQPDLYIPPPVSRSLSTHRWAQWNLNKALAAIYYAPLAPPRPAVAIKQRVYSCTPAKHVFLGWEPCSCIFTPKSYNVVWVLVKLRSCKASNDLVKRKYLPVCYRLMHNYCAFYALISLIIIYSTNNFVSENLIHMIPITLHSFQASRLALCLFGPVYNEYIFRTQKNFQN